MKPLVDALDELQAEYEYSGRAQGWGCTICACRPEEGHADSCPWLTIRAWRADTQAMIEGIRAKAGVKPAITKASDEGIPKEIIEERKRS